MHVSLPVNTSDMVKDMVRVITAKVIKWWMCNAVTSEWDGDGNRGGLYAGRSEIVGRQSAAAADPEMPLRSGSGGGFGW